MSIFKVGLLIVKCELCYAHNTLQNKITKSAKNPELLLLIFKTKNLLQFLNKSNFTGVKNI